MKYHPFILVFAVMFAFLAVMGCQNPVAEKSADANLSALGLSDATISPAFSAEVTSYTAAVPSSIFSTTVTATPAHAGAILGYTPAPTVNLAEGDNTIKVIVTAENGTTTKEYSVTVTRAPIIDNADLASLSLTDVILSPSFSAGVTAYTAWVGNAMTRTVVTAAVADNGATVSVNPASPVDLAVGENTVTVTVTAENGTTTKNYTVVITRSDTESIYHSETFADAGSSERLVTTGYKALTDDPSRPMFLNVRGTTTWEGGMITLHANDRFSMGANDIVATTPTTTPGGCFDFSTPTKLRIRFGAAGVGTAAGYFQVAVNNNTTASRNSPMGISSRIYNVIAQNIVQGSTIDINIPTIAGVDSFLTFRVDAEVTSVQIDEITLVK